MTVHDPSDWQRLGQALKQARVARGLSQADLADLADVSLSSVQNAEAGIPRARMPQTLGPIATALGWPAGGVEAVLSGETPPEGGWRDRPAQGWTDAEEIESIITSAMVRATESATAAEIRAAAKIAVDELRRRGRLSKTNGLQPTDHRASG